MFRGFQENTRIFGDRLYPRTDTSRLGSIYLLDFIRNGLILHLDAGKVASYIGSGTSWNDISPSLSSFTLINNPTFSTNNGGYLTFSNTLKSHAIMASGFSNYQNFTSGITIEAWVYRTDTAVNHRILDFSSGADVNNVMLGHINSGLGTTNSCFFAISNQGGSFQSVAGTSNAYPINEWQHWVGVANGTNFILYKNGVQNASSVNSTLPNNAARTTNYIAASPFGSNPPNEFHTGHIPIVRMYNRALTADEIAQNYEVEKSRYVT
jgi:hypothetical protein